MDSWSDDDDSLSLLSLGTSCHEAPANDEDDQHGEEYLERVLAYDHNDGPLCRADRFRLSKCLGIQPSLLLFNGGEAHTTGTGSLFLLAAITRSMADAPVASFPAEELPRHPSALGRKLLVMDLDNTLIHSTRARASAERIPAKHVHEHEDVHEEEELSQELNFVRSEVDGGGGTILARWVVRVRPGAFRFLRAMTLVYDMCLFTASERKLAEHKVRWLEEACGGGFAFRWCFYREHTTRTPHGPILKDVRMFAQEPVPDSDADDDDSVPVGARRRLGDIILVDDCPFMGALCCDNVLPVRRWGGELDDRVLPQLVRYLTCLAKAADVRPVLRCAFQLEAKAEAVYAKPWGGCALLSRPSRLRTLLEDGLLTSKPRDKKAVGCTCASVQEHNLLVAFRRRVGFDERDHAILVKKHVHEVDSHEDKEAEAEVNEMTPEEGIAEEVRNEGTTTADHHEEAPSKGRPSKESKPKTKKRPLESVNQLSE